MTETPDFNLSALFAGLYKRKKFIIGTTMVAMIAGVVMFLIKPSRYQAEIEFILKNPLYADRNYLYNNDTKFIDYFASDEDIDHLITMSQSDSVRNKIITQLHLADAYKYDTTNAKQALKLREFFGRNLNIYRTDTRNVILTYVDKDQKRALNIAHMCLEESERALHSFYSNMRAGINQSIVNKIHEEDSTIRSLTDTLSAMRIKYGIYDIISPSRYNIMLSSLKDNGRPGYAWAIEEIQNIESVKDQLVSDKARQITLANQYSTGTGLDDLPLTHIVSTSKLPLRHIGLGLFTILAVCTFAGFFFSVLYVLAISFYKSISQKEMDGAGNSI